MRLETYISELLYDHDCVVLPNFGGLVANYRSARLNKLSHIIYPPSKHVGFNRNLRQNDGLLVNHISARLEVDYKSARELVDRSLAGFQDTINKEGRLALNGIGVFFKDKGGQLQFIPDEHENYLRSAYGLSPVQLNAVEQANKNLTAADDTSLIPINDGRRRLSGWKVAAAIAIPLMIGGALLMRREMRQNSDFSFASINPFSEVRVQSYYTLDDSKWDLTIPESPSGNLEQALTASGGTVKYDFVEGRESENGIVVKRETVPAVAATTEVVRETNPARETAELNRKMKFALIGGAFKVEENASNFLNKLKAEGFDAGLAGTKDGMQLVAYGFYSSRREAEQAMKNVRKSGGHAWIRSNQ